MVRKELHQAIQDYIVNYSAEANLTAKTVANKKAILQRLQTHLGDKEFNLQTCRAFLTYLYSNGWDTPNSRLDLVRVLRAFVNFLYKYKYIPENFAQQLQKPKIPRKLFDYIAPEIVENIIDAGTTVGDGDRARSRRIKAETALALRFMLRTGLRINELLEMKGSDLNIYDNPPTYYVNSKGGNRDLLPLPKDMLSILIPRIKNERLFEVTKETCNDVLQRGAKKLGIRAKISNHALRHIFATNLVKNKVPIQHVSRLMRHSSVDITDKTYTHLDVNDLSLMLNSSQSIIRDGLNENQLLDLLEQAVTDTRIKEEKKFVTTITRDEAGLHIHVNYANKSLQ